MKNQEKHKSSTIGSPLFPNIYHLTCYLTLLDASCTIELAATNATSWATIDQISSKMWQIFLHPSRHTSCPHKTSNNGKPNWKQSQNLAGRRWKKRTQSLPLPLATHSSIGDGSSSSSLACIPFTFAHSLIGGSTLSFRCV